MHAWMWQGSCDDDRLILALSFLFLFFSYRSCDGWLLFVICERTADEPCLLVCSFGVSAEMPLKRQARDNQERARLIAKSFLC